MNSKKSIWKPGLTLAWILLMFLPSVLSAAEVEIQSKAGLSETEYCLTEGDCRNCWTTYQTEINQGIYHVRSRCHLPLEDQVPYLGRLLAKIDAAEAKSPAFHTLFWGGLAPGPGRVRSDAQMSMRLALAAFQSPAWDNAKGRPVKGHANPLVRDLANTAGIYPELQRLFAVSGRRIRVSSVEKVLVMPAGKLPFYSKLKAHGVPPDHRLPFDGLTWFEISAR